MQFSLANSSQVEALVKMVDILTSYLTPFFCKAVLLVYSVFMLPDKLNETIFTQ